MTERYAGFLPHLERHLGEAREFEKPTALGRNRGYGLFFCYPPSGAVVSVVSNGLRFQRVTTIFPQELVCTVRVEHRKAAHLLVALSAEMVLRRGVGLMLDEIVRSPGPIASNTRIEAAVATTHPYVDDDRFDALTDDQGQIELQIITLIPLLHAEAEFAGRAGVDELYGAWEERGTDLLDVHRTSAV